MSSENNYKIYYLVSYYSNWYYIGMTKGSIITRFNSHKASCRRGVKSPLYDHMRKYEMLPVLVKSNLTYKDACRIEIQLIAEAKGKCHKILNLAPGGIGGFVVKDKLAWRKKLSKARKGKTPFLGHKHTKESKEKCRKAAINFWKENRFYHPDTPLNFSFKEAREKFGISKTHYYRLKKNAQT